MKIQKLEIMENRHFSKSWKSRISKSSNSPELETFKTKSFEDFALQKQEVLEETGSFLPLKLTAEQSSAVPQTPCVRGRGDLK